MNAAILKFLRHYLAGLIAAMWNGGIGALAGIAGNDGAAVVGVPDVHILDWKAMLSVFFGACILHGIFWLKAHPLPEKFDTNAPFFPTATGATPASPPSKTPDLPTT